MKGKASSRGRKIYADLATGPEAQLLLAVFWQAMADAELDMAARRWLTDPHTVCRAYCALLGISPEQLRQRVADKYGKAA